MTASDHFNFWAPKKLPRLGTKKRRIVDSLILATENKIPLRFTDLRYIYSNRVSENVRRSKSNDFNIWAYIKAFGVKKEKEGWVASSLTLFLAGYNDLVEDRIERELNGV